MQTCLQDCAIRCYFQSIDTDTATTSLLALMYCLSLQADSKPGLRLLSGAASFIAAAILAL